MNSSPDSVTLRPLEASDVGVIAGWAADPAFCREAGWTAHLPHSEVQRTTSKIVESPPRELIRLGVICDGVLVGYVDLHGDEPHRRELGFLVGQRSRWGQGLGCRAAIAGLDHGFTQLGLHQIWAEAHDANRRSVRILQSLGLKEVGKGDDSVFLDQPTYYRQFSTTSQAWANARHPWKMPDSF